MKYSAFNLSLCILLLWIARARAKLNLNMTEYYIMPKLNIFQDYDRCLLEHPNVESIYCMVDVTIKPDNESGVWELIERFSSDRKRRFRHDRLQRGICVADCMKLMAEIDEETLDALFEPLFDATIMKYDTKAFKSSDGFRAAYNRLINQCVNYELQAYRLRAHSTIEYCVSNQDSNHTDWLNVVFIIVYLLINLAVLVSSIYDRRLKTSSPPNQQHPDHYKRSLSSSKDQLLTSFSLIRNWHQMTKSNQRPPLDHFEFMDSIRFLTIYLIICGHTLFFSAAMPTDNPYYMESRLQDVSIVIWTNGATITQTFFVISGFFQSFKFIQESMKKNIVTFSYLWKSILHRYLRLTPIYAFTMLFNASFMYNMQDGPFWPRLQEIERYTCRQNWWSHLLYLNNYVSNTKEMCLTHSWFLAVDFQMYVICVFLLLLMAKLPVILRNCLILLITAITFCIPALVTYLNDYEGIFILEPESVKYGLFYMDAFKKLYIPTHTNMGCYMIGIVAGFSFDLILRHKININQFKAFRIIWFLLIVLGFMVVIAGYFAYGNSQESTVWKYVFALIDKHVWGILAAFFGWGLITKVGGPVRRLINVPLFRFLGKTSYCAYLWHVLILRILLGSYRQPFYSGNTSYTMMANTTVLITFIVSIFLSLIVEYPFLSLTRMIFKAIEPKKIIAETPRSEFAVINHVITKM